MAVFEGVFNRRVFLEAPHFKGDRNTHKTWFKTAYDNRVALGINNFGYDKYWCTEFAWVMWARQGYRLTVPGMSASFNDSNGSNYGFRPMRSF